MLYWNNFNNFQLRLLPLFSLFTLVLADAPDWIYYPGNYQFTAWIVGGIVQSYGDNLAGDGDLFAAFDSEGTVRGVAVQIHGIGPYAGITLYEMTIGSNANSNSLSFQYYDSSVDSVLDIAETYEFITNGQVGSLENPQIYNINYHYDIELDGIDLISFHALPADNSVENMFGTITELNPGILGQGASANYMSGMWLGSLTETDPTYGYWVIIDGDAVLEVEGIPTNPSIVFDIGYGNNLIAYPFSGFAPVVDAIPEDAQSSIDAILGEGSAALNNNGEWHGGLMNLSGTEGYWFIANSDVSFSYNPPAEGAARMASPIRSVPLEYTYNQSTQQAFYFVNSATIGDKAIDNEDIIIAYNGDVIVGSRYWYGNVTDVPAMGSDGSEAYAGYCTSGDKVSFKVWDASEQKLINMYADGEISWSNFGVSVINLSEKRIIPEEISFSSAYPNPFNPVTMLNFSVPKKMDVQLVVYDMMGRVVSELVNDLYESGDHKIHWDASQQSSGIYFVKFQAGTYITTQKLMLVK